ncbi:MAG TPA: YggS family pyridoxal phosphate-dependent enzyme [Burkholderiales bacterium]|nr:YggS family pyridoxal phosphate-dependent enzyme [Burkholderiales bacterium]
MTTIVSRLQVTRARIADAARAAGRDPGSVRLVAVSKSFAPDAVRAAHAAGQSDFGENYLQEALEKMAALAGLPLTWHFIGPIQSNKTRPIAEHFAWVQSVDRAKIAERLSEARPPLLPPLQVCIQVNVSGEASKSGIAPVEAPALARHVAALPGLRLRGLMAIPRPTQDATEQRAQFRVLRRLLQDLNASGMGLDTLSMGMSDDLEAAVAEGATMVRIGTAIFGKRRNA